MKILRWHLLDDQEYESLRLLALAAERHRNVAENQMQQIANLKTQLSEAKTTLAS